MKISVAMCTYNGARHLREQLESIAAQTQLPHELIVCDDASSDESVTIIEDFAAGAHFPVQLHLNTTNIGSSKNFERAISQCSGDVIALCDQDDIWLPTKLARFAVEFARSFQVGMVFTDAEVIDDELRPMGYSLWEKLNFGRDERERLQRGRGFDSLLQGATVTGATAAFRSRFKHLVLPIPDDLPVIHDAWIALLVGAIAEILPLSDRLIQYRQHPGQQVGALERKGQPSALVGGSFSEALTRKNPYLEMLAIAQAVRGRLADRIDAFDSNKILPGLEGRIIHLTARSSLPRGRLQRFPYVLRELWSRRYHRYSNGFRSALKDLFA
ncbi:MAG: glycosyltransferase family 2 protein [Acidobacteriota bacterium]